MSSYILSLFEPRQIYNNFSPDWFKFSTSYCCWCCRDPHIRLSCHGVWLKHFFIYYLFFIHNFLKSFFFNEFYEKSLTKCLLVWCLCSWKRNLYLQPPDDSVIQSREIYCYACNCLKYWPIDNSHLISSAVSSRS